MASAWLPGFPRARQFAGDMAGVAKVGEGVRISPAVAEFPGDAKTRSALKRSHFRCSPFAYQKLVVK